MTRHAPGRRLLGFSIAAIALATLVPAGPGGSTPGFCILCGTRGLSDFLSNILLFAPLGFALARRGHSLRFTALAGLLFTVGIETAQLSVISGRDSNIGDVIANTTGAVAGWLVGLHRGWWLRRDGGMRRSLAVTVTTLALLLAGLALFTPALPPTDYYMQWAARFGNMAHYEGRVLATRLGPLDIPGNGRIVQTDSVRRMLFTAPLDVVATAATPASAAPIVSIYDDRQREIMMLAADRADLIFRYRTIADALRLDHGDIRVHQAFEHLEQGSTYRLEWLIDRKGYCMELEGRGACGRGYTVGDTWSLLMSLDWGTDERAVLRMIWLCMIFVPAGLLAARTRTIAAAALLATLTLLAAPVLSGFAMTPLHQIAAACAGLLAGSLISARYARRAVSESSAQASPTSS